MKCIASLLLTLTLLYTLSGCTRYHQNIHQPVNYYYKTRELSYADGTGVIDSEERENSGREGNYTYHVEQYLKGPINDDLSSPFPKDVSLIQLEIDANTVKVTLSKQLTSISGADLTIACTCLGKTLMELTGLKTVHISIQNDLIEGRPFFTVTEETYLLIDSGITQFD